MIRFFKTVRRWVKRMFCGASKELTEAELLENELFESPSRLVVKAFFRRRLAVAALIVLISMFVFVFIGPYFFPIDLTYTDQNQANIEPNYTMLNVPRGLSDNIKEISGFAQFTVGVSLDNTLYIWGSSKDSLTKKDYADFPEEIKEGNVLTASAGIDHIAAVTTEGEVVVWGENDNGQLDIPAELEEKGVNPDDVRQLICGYQATVLIEGGTLYVWGNANGNSAVSDFAASETGERLSGVLKLVFSNYNALVLMEDGTVTGGSSFSFFRRSAVSSASGKITNLQAYMSGRIVKDIAASSDCYAILCNDGELIVTGTAKYGEDELPQIPTGERIISLDGGTNHFVALTDKGTALAWGLNDGGQTELSGTEGDGAGAVFAGAKQSYAADSSGKLIAKSGFRGYIFGTDSRGRDVFTRIVHGGKMTMTVGAVAVIVSSIIAVIVGCVSGYFGGWVDLLLMRITEIFSAVPFLPFAMLLSYVIKTMPVSEEQRIIIIMIILGLLSWTGLARIIRGQVLSEREKEFVTAAKSMGVSEFKIAFKHILPNIISVVLVSMTLDFAGCLLTESSLSYLGFGVQQPTPTWGNMLNGANNSIVIQNYWWQWVFPAIFLSVATVSINIIGDTLRDVLDPKSSKER